MNYAVVNLGCKVNRVESDEYEELFFAAGYEPSAPSFADIVVVNTCTVTGEADKKTRKAVRSVIRANPQCPIIVTGCAAANDPSLYASMDERIFVIPKAQMRSYLQRSILDHAPSELASVHSLSLPLDRSKPSLLSRSRRGVKVQDGCDRACTYCIVHVARGRSRSEEASAVIERCCDLARSGIMEIVLTGINLGAFSSGNSSLSDLLGMLLEKTSSYGDERGHLCRFRLSSIEPQDVTEELIETIASAQGRICRHLHLPLQSGSSQVLAEMDRGYDAEDYERLVGRLRTAMPSLSLTTDVIVGFPGESDEDLSLTYELSRRCAFSKIHVFPYSMREGTPAASRQDQIPSATRAERARLMRDLSCHLRQADRLSREGTHELAVVEERGSARTESYHLVCVPTTQRFGEMLEVKL